MLTRRIVLLGALGVMLGALPFRSLDGQTPAPWSGRPSIEGFYTQLRFDGDGTTLNADGVGARVMWSPAATGTASGLVGRTSLGLYATYTPDQGYGFARNLRFSSTSVGAVADVRPFESPLAGRVEPFLSLGAGVLRTNVERAMTPAPSPLLAESRTAFALTPGIGARVLLTPDVALQGDVRDVMTFRDDTRHNVGFGLGLRLAF